LAPHAHVRANAATDTRRELARYRIDLRVRALILLSNAILIAYFGFGFLIWIMDIVLVSGKPVGSQWHRICFSTVSWLCLLPSPRSACLKLLDLAKGDNRAKSGRNGNPVFPHLSVAACISLGPALRCSQPLARERPG
jgi:hypothetical protein